ncbi:YesK family protein [Gracilibacillus thailandensis]|uniref:YesK-like protein n=1 Tax=Gracilibacillus thailandensis TaxID=563735 RepID=A0A6N7QVR8_9BACI|nr:YesK family protein [Gracilibacillus thailandensis]MRI66203.1 hypothetical protein [Gracilibacillus thailandensis]
MDIFIPIGTGFIINVVIFIISLVITKEKKKSAYITFFASILTFIVSLVVGSWTGMGIGVISSGMLIASLFFLAYSYLSKEK